MPGKMVLGNPVEQGCLCSEGAQKLEIDGSHLYRTHNLTRNIESDVKITDAQPDVRRSDVSRTQSRQRLVERKATNFPFAGAVTSVINFDNHRHVDTMMRGITRQC